MQAEYLSIYKSNRPQVFYKIDVPKNFLKFTGTSLCQSLFFSKDTGFLPGHLILESFH